MEYPRLIFGERLALATRRVRGPQYHKSMKPRKKSDKPAGAVAPAATGSRTYQPFGAEWEAEVMKLPKKFLVPMLRKALQSKPAPFDEVWHRLRPFLGSDFDAQQAIIVMDHFGWIDNGPCTCGLEIYGDPCPHHSRSENDGGMASPGEDPPAN